MTEPESAVCVECGVEFEPVPWANPTDLICDSCIEDELSEPWR